ncbi:putative catalytic subunit of a class II histone deacetylase complex [Tricharina praecox]|uniref:putative catalytic subunit of a class II histone deacetylase complex n=1 Tax=Tricharina praecox TaxID=43433 RepID=UPI0022203991|nr:putative catalytic subunit of a class II histone deacetylase complex [Tricharina praecox]KAI5852310.1 putative catalytic subunit of a class II histone deacetylase complex [Tricharina praecox]
MTPLRSNGHQTLSEALDISTALVGTGTRAQPTPGRREDNKADDETERRLNLKNGKLLRPNPIKYAGLRTGICYDSRMRFHATINEKDAHPEDPRRIIEIYKMICDAGFVDDPTYSGFVKKGDLMSRIRAREVTKEEAMLVHTLEHWEFLAGTAEQTPDELKTLSRREDSVYFNRESFLCSRLSCGGAIESCMAVVSGKAKNAIAIVRPPGHHAEPSRAMGFCLLNNVSVAVKVVQNQYPEMCKKVLILDWDTAFYKDPSVLYMSIHRYENGNFYPSGPEGGMDQCGEGDGLGRNVNVPWDNAGLGDGDYMYAFQRVIMPIAVEFDPDLVVISAGFDAAAGDDLGGCYVTPAGYAHMTHMLMSLAGGKVVVCLEGGYNLVSISNSALAVTQVLNGEPPGQLHDGAVACQPAVDVVHRCVHHQMHYWRCMRSADPYIVRHYQAKKLWDSHDMSVVTLFRDFENSESFEYQVLATPGIEKSQTVIFYIHDPPPVLAQPEPHTNHIALHDSILVDVGASYIDWAISNGFGVVDANVPKQITGPRKVTYDRLKMTDELCKYLWDNFLQPTDAKDQRIILLGVGDAAQGIVRLLTSRNCHERVKGVISVIGSDNVFRAIVPSIPDDRMLNWYYQNSLVMVSKNHAFWTRSSRGLKKKYGATGKSNGNDAHEVHKFEFERITSWIMDRLED